MLTPKGLNAVIEGDDDLVVRKNGKLYLRFDAIRVIIGEKKKKGKTRDVTTYLVFSGEPMAERAFNNFIMGDVINVSLPEACLLRVELSQPEEK